MLIMRTVIDVLYRNQKDVDLTRPRSKLISVKARLTY